MPYQPAVAKYYVRHLIQKLDNPQTKDKDESEEFEVYTEQLSKEKTDKEGGTLQSGLVGKNALTQLLEIRGFSPERELVRSPLPDTGGRLHFNLRYYRKSYTASYDTGGAENPIRSQQLYYGQQVPSLAKDKEPKWKGHTFLGWIREDDFSSQTPQKDLKAFTSGQLTPQAFYEACQELDGEKVEAWQGYILLKSQKAIDADNNKYEYWDTAPFRLTKDMFVAAKFQLDPEADEEVGALYPELEEGETDEERAERLRYQRFLVPIIF